MLTSNAGDDGILLGRKEKLREKRNHPIFRIIELLVYLLINNLIDQYSFSVTI
jgi:hypothetical protein